MEVNQILQTKDGRVFGNSIIVKKYKSINQKKLDLYDIKMESGILKLGLTARHLRSAFYIPEFFKCDSCGEAKPVKEKFQVVDENYNNQKGLFECAECRGI